MLFSATSDFIARRNSSTRSARSTVGNGDTALTWQVVPDKAILRTLEVSFKILLCSAPYAARINRAVSVAMPGENAKGPLGFAVRGNSKEGKVVYLRI